MTIFHGDSTAYFGRFRHSQPVAYFGFSSVQILADHVAKLEPNLRASYAWGVDRTDWIGSKSMPEFIHTTRTGWQEGAYMARDVLSRLDVPRPLQRQRTHGLAGGSVNVGRMLAGNPAHMRQRLTLPGRKIITIYVEASFSAGVSAKQIVTRATMIAAACDRLEARGYSCEIVTVFTVTDDKVDGELCMHQTTITVKTAGQRLNLDDLVLGIGHPSIFRRYVFALVACEPALRTIWQNQGYPARAFNENHQQGKGEFFIPALQLNDKVDRNNVNEIFRFIIPKKMQMMLDNESGNA